jgi:diguanylate cyclase
VSKPESDLRQKYLDALERLESSEARSRKQESVLRLIIGRLSLAARGRSARLDGELRALGEILRRDPDSEDVEARLEPLSRAVAALDQLPDPQPVREAAAGSAKASAPSAAPERAPQRDVESDSRDERVQARIVAMLERVAALPELEPVLAELNDHPIAALSPDELAAGLEQVARLIGEQRSRLRREKVEVEDLLRQIDARLEEVSTFLAGEAAEQKDAQESTQQLNLLVLDEMHELNTDVQRAIDLAQLRIRVRERLESITTHLQSFRNRQEQRYVSNVERTGRLRVRIAELESESRTLQQSLQEEQRLALIDSLTGIANRAAYDERIRHELTFSQQGGGPVSILAWDIDRFKAVNDAYGHRAGDKVLRVLGQHLAQHVRGTDFVARYGGEEFLMILVGTQAADARIAADKIREGIARIGFHFRNKPVTVTASCGITTIRADDTPDSVFDRADRALYRAKDGGRNCCVIL